jgi:predicted ATPase
MGLQWRPGSNAFEKTVLALYLKRDHSQLNSCSGSPDLYFQRRQGRDGRMQVEQTPQTRDPMMKTAISKPTVHETDEHTLPPFLRRVRIRGFKSIRFCDVPLQPLTILVGRNAAGKSNFLDALAFLRDTMEAGVAEAVKRRNSWSSMVCRMSNTAKVEIEVETTFTCGRPCRRIRDNNGRPVGGQREPGPLPDLTGRTFQAIYHLEFSPGPQSAVIISREKLEIYDETKQLSGGFEVHNGIIQPWEPEPDSLSALSLPHITELLSVHRPTFPLLAVLGKQPFVEIGEGLRSMGFYNFNPDSIRVLQKPNPGRLLEKDGRNLASVLAGLIEIEMESVDRVKDYLATIVEEVEGFTVAGYGDYETVCFRLRGGPSEFPLEFDAAGMSDGSLRALAALTAAFQIVLPHGYPSVVGIEEPETALHPAAMRALVDALDDATQRTQVLLSTHSADLLSGRDVNPGQVLVVRYRDGQTQLTPLDSASREIIQKELYSMAELQRMDKLDLDEADLKRQVQLSAQGGVS